MSPSPESRNLKNDLSWKRQACLIPRLKRGEKKRRQKTLKNRTERKQARQRTGTARLANALVHIRRARDYAIEGCWAQTDWQDGGLAVVVVARQRPDGDLVFGVYLVDYFCLGLKDTYCNANTAPGPFRREHMPKMIPGERPVEISPVLAHEIVWGAIEYAAEFGFKPPRRFSAFPHRGGRVWPRGQTPLHPGPARQRRGHHAPTGPCGG